MPNIRIKAIADVANAIRGLKKLGDTGKTGFEGFKASIVAVDAALNTAGQVIGTATRAVKSFVAAAAAMGNEAATFETKFTEVTTLLGDRTPFQAFGESAEDVKAKLLDMAGGMGTAEELTQALYQAISAGQKPAEALKFIEESAKLAVGGVTTLDKAVKLNAITLNAYRLEADELQRVQDTWFKTVELGLTTVDELADNLGKVIPTAASLGIEMEDVGAAMAQLTAAGIPTARAASALATALATLAARGKKFAAVGIDIQAVIDERGLAGAMDALEQATGGSIQKLSEFGIGIDSHKALLNLMGRNADALGEKLGAMADKAGAADDAFGKMSKTTEFALEDFDAAMKTIKIKLGDLVNELRISLLPAIKETIGAVDMDKVQAGLRGAAHETSRWNKALAPLNKGWGAMKWAIGALLAPLTVTVVAADELIDHFVDVGEEIKKTGEKAEDTGDKSVKALEPVVDVLKRARDATAEWFDALMKKRADEEFERIANEIKALDGEITQFGKSLSETAKEQKKSTEEAGSFTIAVKSANEALEDGSREVVNFGRAAVNEMADAAAAAGGFLDQLAAIKNAVSQFQLGQGGEDERIDVDTSDPGVKQALDRLKDSNFLSGHVKAFLDAAQSGDVKAMRELIQALEGQALAIPRATKGGMEFRGKVRTLAQTMSQIIAELQRSAQVEGELDREPMGRTTRRTAPAPGPAPAPAPGPVERVVERAGVGSKRMESLLSQAVAILAEINRRLMPGVTGIVYDNLDRNEI